MRRKNGLLIFSLGLNLCLGAWGFDSLRSRQVPGPVSPDGKHSPSRPEAQAVPVARSLGFHWSQLESTDYRTYIANLRAIGCPEETVRDIILAELDKLYRQKLADLSAAEVARRQREGPRRGGPGQVDPQRELFREKNAVVKELLGIDLEAMNRANDPSLQRANQRVAFLPEPKQGPVRAWEDKYTDEERQIYANAKGVLTDANRAALAALQQQKAAELNTLLTPDEQFEYAVRNSPAAQQLHVDLGAVQPSDAEFRAIYQAQAALQGKLDAMGGLQGDDAQKAASTEAWNEYNAQMQAVLGDQRYADYQRSKDPDYQTLLGITDRYGIAPEMAGQVLDLKQSTESQAGQVMADTQLSANQKQVVVQALRSQAQANLVTLLGQQAFDVYRQRSGGWLGRN